MMKKVYLLTAGYDGVIDVYMTQEAAEAAKAAYVTGSLVAQTRQWWRKFGPGNYKTWEECLAANMDAIEQSWYVEEREVLE